jgi:uncharacterized protein (DUF1697 family)
VRFLRCAGAEGDGFDDVVGYVQSGNVVLSASGAAAGVAKRCERVIVKLWPRHRRRRATRARRRSPS